MLPSLLSSLTNGIAVDLGTAKTVLYVKGRGIVANEPSFVAVEENGTGAGRVAAIGKQAKELRGRTAQNIQSVNPLRGGSVQDFELAGALLTHVVHKNPSRSRLLKSRTLIGVGSSATALERKAIIEAAQFAGSGEVYLIDESLAAAIGAGLPLHKACGSMIVDIGAGTTDVTVLSLNGIVCSESIESAGARFDEKIAEYVRKVHHVAIGEQTAEEIKLAIGAALPGSENPTYAVRGRHNSTGLPACINLSQTEVVKALSEPLEEIVEVIKRVLDKTPPEIAADIMDRGMTLVGAGALLSRLDAFISSRTSLTARLVEEASTAVARGAGRVLENWADYEELLVRA
jgi:rod shape-determining protein MreB